MTHWLFRQLLKPLPSKIKVGQQVIYKGERVTVRHVDRHIYPIVVSTGHRVSERDLR